MTLEIKFQNSLMNQQRSHKKNNKNHNHKLFSFFKHNILEDKTLVFLEISSNKLIRGKAHLPAGSFMNLMILLIQIAQLLEEINIK